jgi:hypothetical protein
MLNSPYVDKISPTIIITKRQKARGLFENLKNFWYYLGRG